MVKWIVVLALSLQTGCGLAPIATQQDTTLNQYISFGCLPKVNDLAQETFSAWVYATSLPQSSIIFTNYFGLYYGNFQLWASEGGLGDGHPVFSQFFTGNNGQWRTDNDIFTGHLNEWIHIVVTFDTSSAANNPIFYVNGSSVPINEYQTPSGTVLATSGNRFILGNRFTSASTNYPYGFKGMIFDSRVYNRILTAAEVTTLYNAGNPDISLVTDGLVFQGVAVRTDSTSKYIDQPLTSSLTVRDNIYGAVGVPHGSPIGRVSP